MKRFVALVAVIVFCGFGEAVSALEPEREGQEDSLKRALYAHDHLWLLSDAGQLFSLSVTETLSLHEDMVQAIHDICTADGRLVALTQDTGSAPAWTLWSRDQNHWNVSAIIPAKGDEVITLACTETRIVLLTTQRLITLSGERVTQVPLRGKLGRGVPTVLMTADSVYVGYNAGEWGGGLQRIDRHSGRVHTVGDGKDICGGLLNKDCHPVTGLAVVPWQPGCVAVSVGLIHFMSNGRLVMACDDEPKLFYQKIYLDPTSPLPPDSDYPDMVAFYGLTVINDRMVAIGMDGIYTFLRTGEVRFEAMPTFTNTGPFRVNFDQPEFILVLSTINRRTSVSDSMPVLVPVGNKP